MAAHKYYFGHNCRRSETPWALSPLPHTNRKYHSLRAVHFVHKSCDFMHSLDTRHGPANAKWTRGAMSPLVPRFCFAWRTQWIKCAVVRKIKYSNKKIYVGDKLAQLHTHTRIRTRAMLDMCAAISCWVKNGIVDDTHKKPKCPASPSIAPRMSKSMHAEFFWLVWCVYASHGQRPF